MERVKKNDTVQVVTGRDKGKKGSVIEILPKKGKVLVKGIAVVSKHFKPRRQGEVAGIKKIESYLDISNVMPVCGSCKKPTRVQTQTAAGGKKSRICSKCKEQF